MVDAVFKEGVPVTRRFPFFTCRKDGVDGRV